MQLTRATMTSLGLGIYFKPDKNQSFLHCSSILPLLQMPPPSSQFIAGSRMPFNSLPVTIFHCVVFSPTIPPEILTQWLTDWLTLATSQDRFLRDLSSGVKQLVKIERHDLNRHAESSDQRPKKMGVFHRILFRFQKNVRNDSVTIWECPTISISLRLLGVASGRPRPPGARLRLSVAWSPPGRSSTAQTASIADAGRPVECTQPAWEPTGCPPDQASTGQCP